jgi:hypothetical protein
MDFFLGLDPVRYGAFKVEMLNWWNLKSFKPPAAANEMNKIAGT